MLLHWKGDADVQKSSSRNLSQYFLFHPTSAQPSKFSSERGSCGALSRSITSVQLRPPGGLQGTYSGALAVRSKSRESDIKKSRQNTPNPKEEEKKERTVVVNRVPEQENAHDRRDERLRARARTLEIARPKARRCGRGTLGQFRVELDERREAGVRAARLSSGESKYAG